MGLTSEQVHWIGGAAFIAVALVLLLRQVGVLRFQWLAYLFPALLIAYGAESFIDLWLHGQATPANYVAESSQHYLQGTAMLAGGVIEALRAAQRLRARVWSLAIPLALAVLAAIFLVHQQHDATVSPLVLIVQHRAFAVTLLGAAVFRIVADWGGPRASSFGAASLTALLFFGVLMLLYTEGAPAGPRSTHESHS